MLKKYVFYFGIAGLLVSCQKEELISATVPEVETVMHPEEIEITSPEITGNESIFNWIDGQQATSGLLTSSENLDFVSLYDNALAVLLFTQKGELNKAERILDFFESRIASELEMETGGFYQFRNAAGENGSRRWLGDNAWLLIAINHYHKASHSNKYNVLAEKLENWIRSSQDIDGGLFGGYNENGTAITKVTEGILTAYNAIPGYDDFHKNILLYLKNERWDPNLQNLVAWPENEAYTNALDVLALSQSILLDFPAQSLYAADDLFLTTQTSTISGEEVLGYCFDEDKDVVWLEGTSQMAVAFQAIGDVNKSQELVVQIEKTFIQSFITTDAKGIPYVTNHGTNYGRGILWDHADIAPALSTTVWYLFAKMDFNPLHLGKEKDIPEADKFWRLSANL